MKSTNTFRLSSSYQQRISHQNNEKQLFLTKPNITNTNDMLSKYEGLEAHSYQSDSQAKKMVFLGALMFMATFYSGALLYASRNKPTRLINNTSIKKSSHGIKNNPTQKINITAQNSNPPCPNFKKRREIDTLRSAVPTGALSKNATQIKECAIKNGEFTYKKINKPLVMQDVNNLDLPDVSSAISLFLQRCHDNISLINTIISQPTHLYWRKLQLIFPFMPGSAMRELLTNCKAQLLAAKEKINNHDIQFIRCGNDGSLGDYMGGMLRKHTYQLSIDTMVYTNDFARLTDPYAAVNTVYHEIKHVTSDMADSVYYPYPATFLFQVETLAAEIKNIFSDKHKFLSRFSDPGYDIYANATTHDQVTINSIEIKFYVKRTYPRDVATRKSQLIAENKTMSMDDYAKILQTRIFSNSGSINNNEAFLFIGKTSLNDIVYGLLEYVRHIAHQNFSPISEGVPDFIDQLRSPT